MTKLECVVENMPVVTAAVVVAPKAAAKHILLDTNSWDEGELEMI